MALDVWITGGGTREPIDAVRWIGNVSTGRMAVAIARAAAQRGHRVKLYLAEGIVAPRSKRIEVVRFTTTSELRARLFARAGRGPQVLVHAAAVSDYAPLPVRGKVASGQPVWILKLKPLPKVVVEARARWRRALLVMFKLEAGTTVAELHRRALAAARKAGAELVFANRVEEVGREHRGWLLDVESGSSIEARTRGAAARLLIRTCEARRSGP